MGPIVSILIGAAAKVGAPIVKGILEKQLGGVAGEIGGTVIDAIATQAGVSPEKIPSLPEAQIEAAVVAVEQITPALILAHVEQQKEANRLMLAEMDKEGWFGWMWRPAGMWLMLVCVAWLMFLRPLFNALLWGLGSTVQVEIGLDITNFLAIFTIYTGLYMGGNTLIRTVKKGAS
jgi:hypothetical protein